MLFFFLLTDDADDAAFMQTLYEDHYRLMYAQAYQVAWVREDAEDIVSTAIVQLMKHITVLRGLECNNLRAYLVVTVRNAAYTHARRNALAQSRVSAAPLETIAEKPEQGVEARVVSRDSIQRLQQQIASLPPQERTVMDMRYFQHFEPEEIAQHMGIKPVSVRALLSRGRRRLAKILQEGGGWHG